MIAIGGNDGKGPGLFKVPTGGGAFIAMEYVEGKALDELIGRRIRLRSRITKRCSGRAAAQA